MISRLIPWFGVMGVWAHAAAEPPNMLLIVSEDNGPELGCYGDPYAQTPTLDRLAAEGVRFENAFVPYSVCSPSRACFLTGLHPHQNGQLGLATHKFAMFPGVRTLPNMLAKSGYRTGLIGKLHVNPESAFAFGFRAIRSSNFGRRNMKEYAAAARKFFNAPERKPFFLSINYPDAHFPLHRQQFELPAKPIDAKEVKPLPWVGVDSPRLRAFTANYYNCLRRLDDGIAMLLEELKASGHTENTLVIYIGDHGAQFSRGKCGVYEASLRIPMIVRWPGEAKAGQVRPELVSTLDIVPTALLAAGADVPAMLPGRPLQALMEGQMPESWREHIFAVTTGAAPRLFYFQQSVRDRRYKLISSPLSGEKNRFAQCYLTQFNVHFAAGCTAEEVAASPGRIREAYARFLHPPRYELYDLETDPNEFENLADDPAHAEAKARLIAALRQWQKDTGDPFADPAVLKEFADHQEAMTDLGYRKNRGFRWPYLDRFPKP